MHQDTSPAPDRSAPPSSEAALDALSTRWSRFWRVAVLTSTVAVGLVSLGAPEIIRTPITLWFIAICPGMAIVRLLRLEEPIAEMMLALALSLALATLIPAMFLYLGAWSPALSLTTLIAVTATACALDPAIVGRRRWSSAKPPVLRPIALVRRPPRRTLLSAGQRSTSREHVLRIDESAADNPSPAFRSALDRVIGDIAARRQRDE